MRIDFQRAMQRHAYLFFITPAIVLVFAFTAYPAAYGVVISFTNLHFAYANSAFVGFDNYVRLLQWDALPQVVTNTVIIVSIVVALQISLGLAIANLLNQKLLGRRAYRGIAILPWVIPAVVIGLLFEQLFSGSRLGIINAILIQLGFESRSWLSDPFGASIVIIVAWVWKGVPLSIILQLGGLQTVPRELYEAARIDGASAWQSFLYVTLPSLKPILLINLIMATAGSLNHVDIPLTLTGGGPGHATEVLAVSLYKEGFQMLDAGYASTFATVILLINLVLTIIYIRLLRRRDEQAA